MLDFVKWITDKTGLNEKYVRNCILLLDEGNTLPFVARYRKIQTGNMEETDIRAVEKNYAYIKKVLSRQSEIISYLAKNGKLDDALKKLILQSDSLQKLEDIYAPFRKTKKTKSDIAIEKGLKPVSEFLKVAKKKNNTFLSTFVRQDCEIYSIKDVIENASYIIAEEVSHDLKVRDFLRNLMWEKAFLLSEKKDNCEDDKELYKLYYNYRQSVKKIQPYKFLAIQRGVKERILSTSIEFTYEPYKKIAFLMNFTHKCAYISELMLSVEDSCKRLLYPSIQRDVLNHLREKAEQRATKIFSKNLKHILMTPPLKKQKVLGVDPGYRSGCKIALVDENNKLRAWDQIFPNPPLKNWNESSKIINRLYERFNFTIIAIGNGTASRETEEFIDSWLKNYKDVSYIIVSESGASVYSASESAKLEFPDLDLTFRSAVSIARRVLNPMDEFLKIPPESIGVGMYQHDIPEKTLKAELDKDVESVVSSVGVDLNNASEFLMRYISGLNAGIAKSIVEYRNENGSFSKRQDLLKVKGVGKKTYEQAVGFCRVPESKNKLDNTIIHPESYELVHQIFKALDLMPEIFFQTKNKHQFFNDLDVEKLGLDLRIDRSTLMDLIDKLITGHLDPRNEYPQPELRKGLLDLKSLNEGLIVDGTIKNIVDFGVFVDIGIKENGLIHKSNLPFTEDFYDILFPGQIVQVKILEIDRSRARISLEYIKSVQPGSV